MGAFMAHKALIASLMVSVLPFAAEVSAQSSAPSVPTALVENVKGERAGVEFMDYVQNGQLIRLKSHDHVVLGYLKSCAYETITGGMVTVGAERSEVRGGHVVRTTVPCDGGKVRVSAQQTDESTTTSFRSVDIPADYPRLHGQAPLVRLPGNIVGKNEVLLIERTDQPGERHEFKIDDATAAAGFFDLAKQKIKLVPGATYDVRVGTERLTVRIDAKAKSGTVPVLSRLVSFQ
jgi:hypothetical protein